MSLIKEFYEFTKENKKMWILPLVITFLLLGSLLILTQGSVVAPFIYSLF